jgi:hypothetical protein
MRSRLAGLSWEIWQRGRRSACLVAGCVFLCALVNLAAPDSVRLSETGRALLTPLFGLLMVVSFLLWFGIFNYTEFNSTKEWNGFPYRLFALPLRTLQLVALPMFLGVASVELVYLAWVKLVLTHENIVMSEWFAVLVGAYMIFYQAALWSLAGFRLTRILVLGFGGASSVGVACLPMFASTIPSPWLSEKRLLTIVVGLAVIAFGIAWASVARQRCGGGRRRSWIKTQLDRISDAIPRRSKGFTSPAAAQFWFEWRRSGLLLPVCCAFALVVIIAPFAWFNRDDPRYTMYVLVRVLAIPIVLAFAIGKGFIKPEFWSPNLSLAPFLAVRPLPAGEFVVSKLKVAVLSVAITWLLVLAFIALWLALCADITQLNQLWREFRMFYPRSWPAITVLYFAGFVVLTWRCMVSGLWVGLSGNRLFYIGSLCLQVIVPTALLIVGGFWSDNLDSEIRDHPDRVAALALSLIGWILALAIVAKVWLAAFSWNKISPGRTRRYLLIWSGVTLCFIALGILSRPPLDFYRLEHLYILAALLLVPFARLGLAPLAFARNRHR